LLNLYLKRFNVISCSRWRIPQEVTR